MADNQTPMVYFQPIPKLVQLSGGRSYYFDVKFGVSLAWVDSSDVGSLLNIKGGCCGGQRQVIFQANDNQVRLFQTGDR